MSLARFPVRTCCGRLADVDCRMILIACVLLACFPPGILFPQMAARMSAREREGGKVAEELGNQEKGGTEAVIHSNRLE